MTHERTNQEATIQMTLYKGQCKQLRQQLATVRRAILEGNPDAAFNWLAEAEKVARGEQSTWQGSPIDDNGNLYK
jgi:hypothetical protein